MNQFKYIFVSIFTCLCLFGCKDDDLKLNANDFSDVTWYTSIAPGKPYAVAVGEHISFMDASQGVLTHHWEIDSGNYYLSPDFNSRDTLDKYIMEGVGTIIEDVTANVLFKKSGIQRVRLYNTFSEEVTYRGYDTLSAVQREDGIWVIDTAFQVDVYADIDPHVFILKNDEVIAELTEGTVIDEDKALWDTLEINAGDKITYIDSTKIGRPDYRLWKLVNNAITEEGASLEEITTTFHFEKLGNQGAGSVSIQRANEELPMANLNVQLPYIFKVKTPEIQPSVIVKYDGNEIFRLEAGATIPAESEWPIVDLSAGEKLEFIDVSTVGQTNNRTWKFSSGSLGNSTDSIAINQYWENGTHKVGAINAIRKDHDYLINGSKEVVIPLKVNVTTLDITPTYSIYYNDAVVFNFAEGDVVGDPSSWPIIDVQAGDKLVFKDETLKGSPTSILWELNNANPSTSTDWEVEAGYTVNATDAFEAGTVSWKREGMPIEDDNKSLPLPFYIQLLFPQEPTYINSDISQTGVGTNVLSFTVSENLQDIDSDLVKADFDVLVKQYGFEVSGINIKEVRLNQSSRKQVEIEFDAPIYNSDSIYVAYSGDMIKSLANVSLEHFENKLTVMQGKENKISGFVNPGFAQAIANNGGAYGWWTNVSTVSRYEGKSSDGDNACLQYLVANYNGSKISIQSTETINIMDELDEGWYEITMDFFIPEGVDLNTFKVQYRANWTNIPFDVSSIERGKWVQVSKAFYTTSTIGQGRQDFVLMINSVNDATGDVEFYVDNFRVTSVEKRP
ncbi:hypothetical protein MY04_4261 [Flammeovirga sp. MY04]|uniref:hypothetical protein n=1 Tax=Flammeovirga sp. MY04 TaxID=1191459 RepID=UPI000806340C|nr:hypothetical protein [Flammeovirga sp. MY04]ANQ51603.1 hypothetical protein MY04_4261 [Flammeovirga sp. MY04]